MIVGTLNIEGKKFRVIPGQDYQAMKTALRQQQRQAAEDRTDVLQAVRRLNDRRTNASPGAR